MNAAWPLSVRWPESGAAPATHHLAPDETQRARIAKDLGLQSLPALGAEVTVKPWMDGVEITGRFEAVVGQLCAVSSEPFEHPLSGEINLRAVPTGSPHAPADGGEAEYDPEAPDPPDVLEGPTIDLAHYVVEHLALEIDPFARKPGAVFNYTPPDEPESPFAVLKKLQDPKA